jgi:hypothetical protein
MWDFDRGLSFASDVSRLTADRKAVPQGLGNEIAAFVGVIFWRWAAVLSRSLKAAGKERDLRAERARP